MSRSKIANFHRLVKSIKWSNKIVHVTWKIFREKTEINSVINLLNSAVSYIFTRFENFSRLMETGIFRPGKSGKCFKLKPGTFREGTSDHLLSVTVKSRGCPKWFFKLEFFVTKSLSLRFILSASVLLIERVVWSWTNSYESQIFDTSGE